MPCGGAARLKRAIIMLHGAPPRGGGILWACAILFGLGAHAPPATAAEITWDRSSPFQGCLEAGLAKWLEVQVDNLTNENPASKRIDDGAVFLWARDAVASCKAKFGDGDE